MDIELDQFEEKIKSIPTIYLGELESKSLEGFSAVTICLNATLDSDLNWEQEKKQAQLLCSKYQILWDIQLGLFEKLPLPLSDTSQFRSLNLALDQFFDFILASFKDSTLGAILYKGSIDLSHRWPWGVDQVLNFRGWLSEQFINQQAFVNQIGITCSDFFSVEPEKLYESNAGKNLLRFYCMRAALDYFAALSSRFESDLLPYVLFDGGKIDSPTHLFQLIDFDDFEFIQLAIKHAPFYLDHAMGWESASYANGFIGQQPKTYHYSNLSEKIGIVIQTAPIYDSKVLEHYDSIIEKTKQLQPLKLISERNLTLNWQGLEYLIVVDVASDTLRQLEGFIAAGGTVVKEGSPLHLSKEVPYSTFIKTLRNS